MFVLSNMYHKINIARLMRCYSVSKADPGINLRKKALGVNEELDEMELFDDLESDFMNVHKTHKEHITDIKAGLEKEKFQIIRQKYFKEKQLNFLTWHDKEQMKYLYTSDPEEWTVDKLSEGFPALPDVVKKIVKSKWTLNPARVTNHDRTVQRNWENFKKGQIPNLRRELVNHLNKFTSRSLNFKPFETPNGKTIVNVNVKPTNTEFSDIITSYNELKAKKHDSGEEVINVNTETLKNMSSSNKFDVNKKINNKPITLHELQDKLECRLNMGKDLPEDEKLMLKNLKRPLEEINLMEQSRNSFEDVMVSKFETNKIGTVMKKKQQDLTHLIYPERITIPKNVWKKGFTYKLNDCYYDDDGLFLYRVPGMD